MDYLTSSDSPGKVHVTVGSRERYNDSSPTHPRCILHGSRQRIRTGGGQIRLDAIQQCIPEDQPVVGSQWTCLPTPLVSDWSCPQQDQGTTSSSLEEPGLVPSTPGDVDDLIPPQEDLLQRGQDHRGMDITPQLAIWPVSGRSMEVTAASELTLASWRTKSSQTYDSLFRKWASWCSERDHNPISGSVADVANFLAYLHKEGYQSRSLNAYRSDISSVHDLVNGVEVGKHPVISRLLKGAYHVRPHINLPGMCK